MGDLPIDPSQYRTIARRADDILYGRKSLYPVDAQIEKQTRDAVDKLFARRAGAAGAGSADGRVSD